MSTFKQYGHEFTVADPYQAGHKLTEAEAAALNSARAEMISHQLRAYTTSHISERPSEHEFTAEDIAAMQDKLAEIEKSFEFGASGSPGRTSDPVAVEAREIARAAINKKLAEIGKEKAKRGEEPGPHQISHEDYVAKVNEVAAREDVRKKARANVEAAQKAAESVSF